MKNLILLFLIIFFQTSHTNADGFDKVKRIIIGKQDAKITIIAYESLTCSHCANFHIDILPYLKKEYIDTGIAKIEFRHFPLDVAAFNASKIAQCRNDGNSDILNSLYLNQSKWIKGKTIEEVNENLKKFLISEKIRVDFDKCTNDKSIEDFVLNDRIEGVKKFKINATPTIIINDKKFNKSLNYENLKKSLEKLI